MEYIQTSGESFLYNVIEDMEKAFKSIEKEFEPDFDSLATHLENNNYLGQLEVMLATKGVNELDKKYVLSYGSIIFGLITDIKNQSEDNVDEALELSYKFIESNEDLNIQVKLYLVLYNIFDQKDKKRYEVFVKLLKFLEENNAVVAILSNIKSIQKVSEKWNITNEQRINIYKHCIEILVSNDETLSAYDLILKTISLVGSDKDKIEQNEELVKKGITIALQHPKIVNFDVLYTLPAVKLLTESKKADKLYELLHIFTYDALNEYSEWESKNKAFLESSKIEADICKNKMMYLAVCVQANQDNVISYDKLSDIVGIPRDQVEEWIIDAIVNKIIDARLDQENECIIVSFISQRNMNDPKEWQRLQQKLQNMQNKNSIVMSIIQ